MNHIGWLDRIDCRWQFLVNHDCCSPPPKYLDKSLASLICIITLQWMYVASSNQTQDASQNDNIVILYEISSAYCTIVKLVILRPTILPSRC